jgi:hypothetical protein
MCIRSPTAAETNATKRNVMPAHNKLPVKKKTAIAARAAIGKANKNPMKTIAINAIMSRTIRTHQKPGSVRLIV